MSVLFILKKNECYGFKSYTRRSSGLWNSTRFIVESLQSRGIEADIVEVNDNNDIDRVVALYEPDQVVIEALWVVPEKFTILSKLHPNVSWYVHLHSHMPFLALEGIAMEWILKCANMGVTLIANSKESYDALRAVLYSKQIIYLPNVYLSVPRRKDLCSTKEGLDIGCFGAVRPLKNQLIQALAAIEYARRHKVYLRFHINSSRVETGGSPVLKNLMTLFALTPMVELVQCPWMEPEEFLDYLQSTIDIGMQVSLTETFNVVCADYVTAGVPVVASDEVKWICGMNQADDDDMNSIISCMEKVRGSCTLVRWNQRLLMRNSHKAQRAWAEFTEQE